MKTMKLAACAAMALAAVASGQTTPTSAEYEMRLVPPVGSGLLPGSGPQNTLTPSGSGRYVVQARARTPAGTTNYGINRWSSGSITGSAGSTVTRATSSSAAAFGRFRSLALGEVNSFARVQPAAGTGGTSATGVDANNVNGVVSGNSITGVDANRGLAWGRIVAPLDPDTGAPIFEPGSPLSNPWGGASVPGSIGGPITDGSWGAWQNLYAFTYLLADFSPLIIVAGSLNIASSIAFVDGSWTFGELPNATSVTIDYSWAIPTPSAVAVLGFGSLAAARRRR